ncbi:phosphoglycerate dehydrogenase [Sutcliffiella deserti]|uniref:phosphoglycerate dehydrogenase n=1 Tax=Sutcliffiella deserti TaxID=2875501 RepID=UPI001CC01CEF|nr:phosphoglycerate dehydrogenase [Sutcliffiella deserti]
MKVIVTSPSFGKFHDHLVEDMEGKGCKVLVLIPYSREKMLKEIVDADALIVGLETIDQEIIDSAKQLKVIAKHGVGVDNIDIVAASEKGIAVTNAPGTNNDAVADLAFCLMLSVARSIPAANNLVKNQKWGRFDGVSVWGKTLGVVGLGAIGRGVAQRASGFNMKVLGYDISEPSAEDKALNIERVSLQELITSSDYISLHVPLNKYTEGMIGEKQFEMMKSNAILINTARGGVINEKALYNALTTNKIRGCGLDVFEQEPPENHDLVGLSNLVVSPHIGAYTNEAVQLTSQMSADNIYRLLNNQPLENIMNPVHGDRSLDSAKTHSK